MDRDREEPVGTTYFETLIEDHVDQTIPFSEAVSRYMRDELSGSYRLGGGRFEETELSTLRDDFKTAYQRAWQAVEYLEDEGELHLVYHGGTPVLLPDSEGLIEEPPAEEMEDPADSNLYPAWSSLLSDDDPETEEPLFEGPFDGPLTREGEAWDERSPMHHEAEESSAQDPATTEEEREPVNRL